MSPMAPTVQDLIRRAAEEPETSETSLSQALRLAERDGEGLTLLRGLRQAGLATPDRLVPALALALAEGEKKAAPWCFREVASAQAESLEDLEAAAATLRRGEQVLQAQGSVLGLCLLAEAWADALADEEGVRRCLQAAERLANGASDISHIVGARYKILGEVAACEALLRALPSPADALTAWTLGNAWRAIERPEEAGSVLHEALRQLEAEPTRWASPVEQALTLGRAARAWESDGKWVRALSLAEKLAKTAEDHLEIAETCMSLSESSPQARRAIAAVERLATTGRRGQPKAMDEGLRLRLVPLCVWTGDREALERLAPAGALPNQLAPPLRELPGFEPDACGLLDHLRPQLDERQLQHIAAADYGYGAPLHLAQLQQIVRTGHVPPLLRWEPGEVLRLCRWSTGERTDHVVRAFCATVILICSDQDSPGNDAPILVESALTLRGPSPALAEGLLCHRYAVAHAWQTEEQIATLWGLALLVAARDPGDSRLHALAERLESLAEIEEYSEPSTLEKALRYTQKQRLWDELIELYLRPHAARPAVRRILAKR